MVEASVTSAGGDAENYAARIDAIVTGAQELSTVTKSAIEMPKSSQRTIKRNFQEFCTSLMDKICAELTDKNEAVLLLCE